MKRKLRKDRSRVSGFSLVEVTLAMAIAAVALVTLFGLLPQGLNTMREAGDLAIGGRIHQQVLNEIQMADFDSIGQFDGLVIYYDAQGEEIDAQRGGAGSTPPTGTVYSARVVLQPDTAGRQFMRPVTIQVAATGERSDFDWDSEDTRLQRTNHQTMVVKMQRDEI